MGPLSARSHPGQELVATRPTKSKPGFPGEARGLCLWCAATSQRRSGDGDLYQPLDPECAWTFWIRLRQRSRRLLSESMWCSIIWRLIKPMMFCFFTWPIRGFEFVFQPKYAAYLNLIEPWWKTRKSLALKGKKRALKVLMLSRKHFRRLAKPALSFLLLHMLL